MNLTRRDLIKLLGLAPPAAAGVAALTRPTVASVSAPAVAMESGQCYSVGFLRRHLRSFTTWASPLMPGWVGRRALYHSWPETWRYDPVFERVCIPESDAFKLDWIVLAAHNLHTYTLRMSRLPEPLELEGFHGFAGRNNRFDFPDCDWVAYGNGEVLHSRDYRSFGNVRYPHIGLSGLIPTSSATALM